MKDNQIWATLVVRTRNAGRSVILNSSQRGIFKEGAIYFNHQLKAFKEGMKVNVTIRLSKTGRRMVQGFLIKDVV